MTAPTPQQILDLPMEDNDSGADTVRGYLVALLATLWQEGEGFGGKRPFGNSGWDWDLMRPLVKAGYITGKVDEDGFLDDCDDRAGRKLIAEAIDSLNTPPAPCQCGTGQSSPPCAGCGSLRVITRGGKTYCTESACDRRLPGPPCGRCQRPAALHVCLTCSSNGLKPGPGCINCRSTGWDQTPCRSAAEPQESR